MGVVGEFRRALKRIGPKKERAAKLGSRGKQVLVEKVPGCLYIEVARRRKAVVVGSGPEKGSGWSRGNGKFGAG